MQNNGSPTNTNGTGHYDFARMHLEGKSLGDIRQAIPAGGKAALFSADYLWNNVEQIRQSGFSRDEWQKHYDEKVKPDHNRFQLGDYEQNVAYYVDVIGSARNKLTYKRTRQIATPKDLTAHQLLVSELGFRDQFPVRKTEMIAESHGAYELHGQQVSLDEYKRQARRRQGPDHLLKTIYDPEKDTFRYVAVDPEDALQHEQYRSTFLGGGPSRVYSGWLDQTMRSAGYLLSQLKSVPTRILEFADNLTIGTGAAAISLIEGHSPEERRLARDILANVPFSPLGGPQSRRSLNDRQRDYNASIARTNSRIRKDSVDDEFLSAYQVMNAIFQGLETILVSRGVGAASFYAKTGKTLSGLRKAKAASPFLKYEAEMAASAKLARGASLGMGAMRATDAFMTEASRAGLDGYQRALLFPFAFGITWGVERYLGPNILINAWGRSASTLTQQILKEQLGEAVKKGGHKSIRDMSKDEVVDAGKKALEKLSFSLKNMSLKGLNPREALAGLQRTRPGLMVVAGGEEGTEEVGEGLLQNTLKLAHDSFAPLLSAQPDMLENGNGLFGVNFEDFGKHSLQEFILGAIGGGAASVFVPTSQRNEMEVAMVRHIAENPDTGLDEIIGMIEQLFQDGALDVQYKYTKFDPVQNKDVDYLTAGEEADWANNNKEELVLRAKAIYNIIQSSGVLEIQAGIKQLTPRLKDHMVDSIGRLIGDYAIWTRAQQEKTIRLDAIKAQAEQVTDEEEKANLEKKAAEIDFEIGKLEEKKQYILDPDNNNYSQAFHDHLNHVRALHDRNPEYDSAALDILDKDNYSTFIGNFRAVFDHAKKLWDDHQKLRSEIEETSSSAMEKTGDLFDKLRTELRKSKKGKYSGKHEAVLSELEEILKDAGVSEEIEKQIAEIEQEEIANTDEETLEEIISGLPSVSSSLTAATKNKQAKLDELLASKKDAFMQAWQHAHVDPFSSQDLFFKLFFDDFGNIDPKSVGKVDVAKEIAKWRGRESIPDTERALIEGMISSLENRLQMLTVANQVYNKYTDQEKEMHLQKTHYVSDEDFAVLRENIKNNLEALKDMRKLVKSEEKILEDGQRKLGHFHIATGLHMLSDIFGLLGMDEESKAANSARVDMPTEKEIEQGRLLAEKQDTSPEEAIANIDKGLDQALNTLMTMMGKLTQKQIEDVAYDLLIESLPEKRGMKTAEELRSRGKLPEHYMTYTRFTVPGDEAHDDLLKMVTVTNFLALAHGVNSVKFYDAYKKVMDEENEQMIKKGGVVITPTVEQIFLVHRLVAKLRSPDDSWLIDAINKMSPKNGQIGEYHDKGWKQEIWKNSLWVRGAYGSGKTTVGIHLSFKIFNELNGGKKLKLLVIAPSKKVGRTIVQQVNAFADVKVMNKWNLLKTKENISEYDHVIFDEAQGMSTNMVIRMAKHFNATMNDKSSVLLLGDENQVFGRISEDRGKTERESYPSVSRFTLRTLPLTYKHRFGNPQIWAITEAIQNSLKNGDDRKIDFPKTQYGKGNSKGVRFFGGRMAVIDLAIEMFEKGEIDSDFAIITNSREDATTIKNNLPDNMKKFVYSLDYSDPSVSKDKNAVGLGFSHVFVAMPMQSSNQSKNKELLTAVSRAKNFVAMEGNPNDSTEVHPDVIEDLGMTQEAWNMVRNRASQMVSAVTGEEVASTETLIQTKVKNYLEDIASKTINPDQNNENYRMEVGEANEQKEFERVHKFLGLKVDFDDDTALNRGSVIHGIAESVVAEVDIEQSWKIATDSYPNINITKKAHDAIYNKLKALIQQKLDDGYMVLSEQQLFVLSDRIPELAGVMGRIDLVFITPDADLEFVDIKTSTGSVNSSTMNDRRLQIATYDYLANNGMRTDPKASAPVRTNKAGHAFWDMQISQKETDVNGVKTIEITGMKAVVENKMPISASLQKIVEQKFAAKAPVKKEPKTKNRMKVDNPVDDQQRGATEKPIHKVTPDSVWDESNGSVFTLSGFMNTNADGVTTREEAETSNHAKIRVFLWKLMNDELKNGNDVGLSAMFWRDIRDKFFFDEGDNKSSKNRQKFRDEHGLKGEETPGITFQIDEETLEDLRAIIEKSDIYREIVKGQKKGSEWQYFIDNNFHVVGMSYLPWMADLKGSGKKGKSGYAKAIASLFYDESGHLRKKDTLLPNKFRFKAVGNASYTPARNNTRKNKMISLSDLEKRLEAVGGRVISVSYVKDDERVRKIARITYVPGSSSRGNRASEIELDIDITEDWVQTEINNEIAELEDAKGKVDSNDIEDMKITQTFLENMSFIINRETGDANTTYWTDSELFDKSSPIFAKPVKSKSTGKYYIRWAGQSEGDAGKVASAARRFYQMVKEKGYESKYQVGIKIDNPKAEETPIPPEHWTNMKLRATSVGFPRLHVEKVGVEEEQVTEEVTSDNNEGLGGAPNSFFETDESMNPPFMLDTGKVPRKFESKEEQVKYLKRIFGKKFVENRLKFKSKEDLFRLYGEEIWGVMDNLSIMLREDAEGVHYYAAAHEAMHYALNHLVRIEDRDKIIDSAKEQMMEDTRWFGMRKDQITRKNADEWIAEKGQSRYRGITGWVKWFGDMLISALHRHRIYRDDVRNFIYSVESGKFRDAPILNRESVRRMMEEESEEKRPFVPLSIRGLNVRAGNGLIYTKTRKTIISQIKGKTRYNTRIDNEPVGDWQAVMDVYNDILAHDKTVDKNRMEDMINENGLHNLLIQDGKSTPFSRAYMTTIMAKPEYFFGIVKSEYKNYRINYDSFEKKVNDNGSVTVTLKAEYSREQGPTDTEESSALADIKENINRTNMYDDEGTLSVWQSVGDIIKSILFSMERIEFAPNNKPIRKTGEYVSRSNIESAIATAASNLRGSSMSNPDYDPIVEFFDNMRLQAGFYSHESPIYMDIMTFLNEFDKAMGMRTNERVRRLGGKSKFGFYELITRRDEIEKSLKKHYPEYNKEAFDAKVAGAADIIAQIGQMLSFVQRDYGHVILKKNFKTGDLYATWKAVELRSVDEVKNRLKDRLINRLINFNSTETLVNITRISELKEWEITATEITYRKDVLLVRPNTRSKWSWATEDKGGRKTAARHLRNFLGIKSEVNDTALDIFLGNIDYQTALPNELSPSNLARTFATLVLAEKAAVQRIRHSYHTKKYKQAIEEISRKGLTADERKEALAEIEEKNEESRLTGGEITDLKQIETYLNGQVAKGYGEKETLYETISPDSEIEIRDNEENEWDEDTEETFDVDEDQFFYHPALFYRYLELLGEGSVAASSKTHTRTYRTPDGKKMHTVVDENLFDRFYGASPRLHKVFSDDEDLNFASSPMTALSDFYPSNTFATGQWKIIRTVKNYGSKGNYVGRKHGQLVHSDFLVSMLDGAWMKSVRKSVRAALRDKQGGTKVGTRLWVPDASRADTSPHSILHVDFGTPLFKVYTNRGEKRVGLNYEFIFDTISNIMRDKVELREQRANKFGEFLFEYINAKQPDSIGSRILSLGTTPDPDSGRVSSLFIQNTISQALAYIGTVEEQYKVLKEESGLYENLDFQVEYEVDEHGNKHMSRILVGQAISMEMGEQNPIYTDENYEILERYLKNMDPETTAFTKNEIRDLKEKFIVETFLDRYTSLRKHLASSGYSIKKYFNKGQGGFRNEAGLPKYFYQPGKESAFDKKVKEARLDRYEMRRQGKLFKDLTFYEDSPFYQEFRELSEAIYSEKIKGIPELSEALRSRAVSEANKEAREKLKENEDFMELFESMLEERRAESKEKYEQKMLEIQESIEEHTEEDTLLDEERGVLVNPFYFGAMMAYHMVNHYIDQTLQGAPEGYESVRNYHVRSAMSHASGAKPWHYHPGGVDRTMNFVSYGWMQEETRDDMPGFSAAPDDGSMKVAPWTMKQLGRSYGGQNGRVGYNDHALKPVIGQKDPNEPVGLHAKVALFPIGKSLYEASSFSREAIKTALPGNVRVIENGNVVETNETGFQRWLRHIDEQGWDAAVDDVIAYSKLKDSDGKNINYVVHGYINDTSIKTPVKNVIDLRSGRYQSSDDIAAVDGNLTVFSENFRIQLDLSRSEPSRQAPYINQFIPTIGILPQNAELLDKINDLHAQIIEKFSKSLDEVVTKGDFENWIRKIGSDAAKNMLGHTLYSSLIDNPNVHIDIPVIRHALQQQVFNHANKFSVKPKVTGQSLKQAPGAWIDVYESGGVSMLSSTARRLKSMGVSVSSEPGKLGHYRFENGQLFYGQAVIPYLHYKKMGIRVGMQPQDVYGHIDSNGNFHDMRKWSVEKIASELQRTLDERGYTSMMSQFVVDKVIDRISWSQLNQYAEENATQATERMPISSHVLPEEAEQLAKLREKFDENAIEDEKRHLMERASAEGVGKVEIENGATALQVAVEIKQYLNEFDETLRVVVNRTPSNNSSAGLYEVIGWVDPSEGNRGYFPTKKNIRDGTDHDADDVTTYEKHLNAEAGSVQDLQNQIREKLISYLENPANEDIIMMAIDLKKLDDITKDINVLQSDHNDLATMLLMHKEANAGKGLVGIFANVSKVYSVLSHAKNKGVHIGSINPKLIDVNGDYAISNITTLLNSSTDNRKHLHAGMLLINATTANIWGAMEAEGVSLHQAAKLFADPVIRGHIAAAEKTQSLTERTISLYRILDSQMEKMMPQYRDGWKTYLNKNQPGHDEELVEQSISTVQSIEWIEELEEHFEGFKKWYNEQWPKQNRAKKGTPEDKPRLDALNYIQSVAAILDVQKMMRISDYAMKGQAMYRLTQFVQRTQSLVENNEEYGIKSLVRDLEFYLDGSIDSFYDGVEDADYDYRKKIKETPWIKPGSFQRKEYIVVPTKERVAALMQNDEFKEWVDSLSIEKIKQLYKEDYGIELNDDLTVAKDIQITGNTIIPEGSLFFPYGVLDTGSIRDSIVSNIPLLNAIREHGHRQDYFEELEFERKIRASIRIPQVIRTQSPVVEALKVLSTIHKGLQDTFFTVNDKISGLDNNDSAANMILVQQQKLPFVSKHNYYQLNKEFWRYFVVRYLKDGNAYHFSNGLDLLSHLMIQEGIPGSRMVRPKYDVSTTTGQVDFVNDLTNFVEQLTAQSRTTSLWSQATDDALANNAFIQAIGSADYWFGSYVQIDSGHMMSPEKMDQIRIAFDDLALIRGDVPGVENIGKSLQEMFRLYHLLRNALNYEANGLVDSMDTTVFEQFSEWYEDFVRNRSEGFTEEDMKNVSDIPALHSSMRRKYTRNMDDSSYPEEERGDGEILSKWKRKKGMKASIPILVRYNPENKITWFSKGGKSNVSYHERLWVKRPLRFIPFSADHEDSIVVNVPVINGLNRKAMEEFLRGGTTIDSWSFVPLKENQSVFVNGYPAKVTRRTDYSFRVSPVNSFQYVSNEETTVFSGMRYQGKAENVFSYLDRKGIDYNRIMLNGVPVPVVRIDNQVFIYSMTSSGMANIEVAYNGNYTPTLVEVNTNYDHHHNIMNAFGLDEQQARDLIKESMSAASTLTNHPMKQLQKSYDTYLRNSFVPAAKRMMKNGNDISSILKTLANNPSLSEDMRSLARMFLKNANQIPGVQIVFSNKMSAKGSTTKAEYFPGTRRIVVYGPSLSNSFHGNMDNNLARVLLHEMVHPFLVNRIAAWRTDPNQVTQAERDILGELDSSYRQTKEAFPNERGSHDLDEFVSEIRSNVHFRNKYAKRFDRSRLRKAIDSIRNFIRKVFRLNTTISAANLDRIDKLTGDLIANFNPAIDNRHAHYVSKSSYSLVEKKKDIGGLLDLVDMTRSFTKKTDDEMVDYLYKQHLSKKVNAKRNIRFMNASFDYSDIEDSEIRKWLLNEVVPVIREYEGDIIPKFVEWLSVHKGDLVHFAKTFKGFTTRVETIKNRILSLRDNYLRWQHTDLVIRMSDPIAKELGLQVKGFKGMDPLILVHNYDDFKTDGELQISIFDITGYPMLNVPVKEKLFDLVSSNMFRKNERGVRNLMVALQAMAIRSKKYRTQIRNVGTISVTGTYPSLTRINMPSELKNIRKVLESKQFRDSMPDEVAILLNDAKVWYPEGYNPSFLVHLKHWYNAQLQGMETTEIMDEGIYKEYQGEAQKISEFLANKEDTVTMLRAVKARMEYLKLKSAVNRTPEEVSLEDDPEFVLLSELMISLTKKVKVGANSNSAGNWFSTWHLSPAHQEHPLLQHADQLVNAALTTLNKDVHEWADKHTDMINKIVNKNFFAKNPAMRFESMLMDKSSKRFERLWVKRRMSSAEGKFVTVPIGHIHYDKNKAWTKEALRNGEIEESDVEYGAFVVNALEEMMIDYLTYTNVSYAIGTTEEERLEAARETAKKTVDRKWQKGMLPLMRKTITDALGNMQVKDAFNKLTYQLSNVDDIFDEVSTERTNTDRIEMEDIMAAQMGEFFSQDLGDGSIGFGSESRLRKLGLSSNGIEMFVEDENLHNTLSMDIQLIMAVFHAAMMRKKVYDERLKWQLNSIRTSFLSEIKMNNRKEFRNNVETLDKYIDRVVFGRGQKLGVIDMGGEYFDAKLSYDAFFNGLMQFAVFNQLSLNIPSGVTQTMVNTFGLLNISVANLLAGNEYYTPEDLVKAGYQLFTNMPLITKMMDHYQQFDFNTRALTSQRNRKRATRSDPWSSWHAHWFSWAPDFGGRALNLVAQMIKDGSFDAHYLDKNGDLQYNEDADKSLKGDVGKMRRKAIEKEFVDEGWMKPGEKLKWSMSPAEMNSIRNHGAKHILGQYAPTEHANFTWHMVGRNVSMYKKFFWTKMENLILPGRDVHATGRYGLKTIFDEDGNPMKDYVYDSEKGVEGKLQSLANTIGYLYSLESLSAFEWSKLPKRRKANIAKLLLDVALAGVLYLAFMSDWGDDEEKDRSKRGVTSTRLGRSMKYAVEDLVTEIHPKHLKDLIKDPAPAITHGIKLANLLYRGVTLQVVKAKKQFGEITPGGSSVKMINDLLNSE